MNLTVENLTKAISQLPNNIWFEYINAKTPTKIRVTRVVMPEGPIFIERKTRNSLAETSISTAMLRRIAGFVEEGIPLNVDRVLGASYNTRSAFEALIAHTPDFYWCIPGRIELINGKEEIRRGHKHLIYLPKTPHGMGRMVEHPMGSQMAISELPVRTVVYDALTLKDPDRTYSDLEEHRRHVQIQVLLAMIGAQLGYRTWIASNDRNHTVMGSPIGELPGVIGRLQDEKVLQSYGEAAKSALLIDCIWFQNGRLMPAVIEVEHSTGVTSGLTRMKNFQDHAPRLEGIRWVIAAPDESRDEVFRKARSKQFQSLHTKFMPYSAIEELYSLCRRRNISSTAINEGFLDCFMESCSQ